MHLVTQFFYYYYYFGTLVERDLKRWKSIESFLLYEIGSCLLCSQGRYLPLHFWFHWEAEVVLCMRKAINWEIDLWWATFLLMCLFNIRYCTGYFWLGLAMQLRVLKTVLSLPLLGPLTGLVLEWISYLELMGPVRVFQEFWHALVMLVSFLVFMLVVCNFFLWLSYLLTIFYHFFFCRIYWGVSP